MEGTALVTGSSTRVAEVGDALERVGYTVTRVGEGDDVATALASIAPRSLSCYVQLPRNTDVKGETLVERVSEFLRAGLLHRFEVMSQVIPLLGPEASVVLVAGNVPGAATPDDRHARIDLLRVLARAVLAECAGGEVRAVVVGYDRSADDIADIAFHRGDDTNLRKAALASLDPDLPYADWQREFLSLSTTEE
ncbi:MAG TPA: hypothetical protein VI854_08255 [Acidimicrobiia bacterium]|nr:hypothetical protein [Acidimicrobiia bacterium]